MIFRKKQAPAPPSGPPVLRGRGDSGSSTKADAGAGENPLARRFQPDAEPATVDLADPARFHEPDQPQADPQLDPQTQSLRKDPETLGRVISRDTATGKFYIHPGGEDCPVLLENEAVLAPTELRTGDTIRVGDSEFTLVKRP
jgi:hypothetical protein